MNISARNLISTATTGVMLASTIYLYDNQKPLLDYMEYLPVYRVEQLWERQEQRAVGSGEQIAAPEEPKP